MRKTSENNAAGDLFLSHGPVAADKAIINANRVAVWWLPVADIKSEQWEPLRALLNDKERARAKRFHFDADRSAFVAAHAICRGLLSYCYGLPPRAWKFYLTEYGKPELDWDRRKAPLRVNISHTRGLAAVALTQGSDIGIDVESLNRQQISLEIADKFLTKDEKKRLGAVPEAQKHELLLTYWVLKEAYAKATGLGLSAALDKISFDLMQAQIHMNHVTHNGPLMWYFEQCRVDQDYLMALAVKHPHSSDLVVDKKRAPLEYLLGLSK